MAQRALQILDPNQVGAVEGIRLNRTNTPYYYNLHSINKSVVGVEKINLTTSLKVRMWFL
jgi:hypothetical protein